jgi:iron complex outermembrane receptor protein
MHRLHPAAFAVACAFALPGQAQTPAASPAVPPASPSGALSSAPITSAVIVTADPLGRGSDLLELVTPVSVMEGRELAVRRRATLGDTLSELPGISGTGFGPNASRPVIRGLEGDRVRILQNGSAMIDASAASPDHAISVDPLGVDRVEVVRGAAALLYGGNAIGGVVNVIDGRIPQTPVKGISGSVEPRFGGADRERSLGARIDAGDGRLGIHANVYDRETANLRIKGSPVSGRLRSMVNSGAATINAAQRAAQDVLPNSDQRSNGGALGGSVAWDQGYMGLSYGGFGSRYGTVGEPNVRINMESSRLDAAGEVRELGPLRAVRFKLGSTRYEHSEIDAGVVGTVFRSSGHDARVELLHRNIGPLEGLVGVQAGTQNLIAEGNEAFLPGTRTTGNAVFIYEEMPAGPLKLSFGGRYEASKVRADPFTATGAAALTRDFGARSGAFGALWPFVPGYALALNLTRSERAPTATELFADGVHAATSAFELGSRTLGKESSRAVDFSLRKNAGRFTGSAGVFANRFRNYIYLAPAIDPATGQQFYRDGDDRTQQSSDTTVWAGYGSAQPQFNFGAVPANFRGFEFDTRFKAWDGGGHALDLVLRGDRTRASSNGQPLPRIPAGKVVLGLDWRSTQGLRGTFDVIRVSAQNRIPVYPAVLATNLPSSGYTMLNASLSYRFRSMGNHVWEAYLRGTNLGNVEARNHASFLKEVAPLGGRALLAGLRANF